MAELLQHAPPQYQLLFQLMYGSGLRIMELLRIKDIDFSYNSILIWHSKGNKNRGVTLAPELTVSLRNR